MATTMSRRRRERRPNHEEYHFSLSRPRVNTRTFQQAWLLYFDSTFLHYGMTLFHSLYPPLCLYLFRHWKYSKIKINREIKYNQGSLPSAKKFVNKNIWVALQRRSLFFCKSFFCKAQSFTIHQWRTMVVVSFPF